MLRELSTRGVTVAIQSKNPRQGEPCMRDRFGRILQQSPGLAIRTPLPGQTHSQQIGVPSIGGV